MNQDLYPMIFKRRSFHLFRNTGRESIGPDELRGIEAAWDGFERLYPELRTAMRIVPASKVSFRHDAEYCIMLYSESRGNYLMNMGYLGEQLDLYLVSRGIGSLWFGIGRPDEPSYDGLDYVIMIAVRRVSDGSQFRKDPSGARRKPLAEGWSGDTLGVAEVARLAPSAVNSQPWFVKHEGDTLTVFRCRKQGKLGVMPAANAAYFNRIDIGIYLCFLELCLTEKGLAFTRELFPDTAGPGEEYSKVAVYTLARGDNRTE